MSLKDVKLILLHTDQYDKYIYKKMKSCFSYTAKPYLLVSETEAKCVALCEHQEFYRYRFHVPGHYPLKDMSRCIH